MSSKPKPAKAEDRPAICVVVERAGGALALSRKLDGRPAYQEIQRWTRRGWCSHLHIFRLKPHLPRGIRLEDLAADRERAKAAA